MKRSCEYGATCAVRAPLFLANCDIGPNDRTREVSTTNLRHPIAADFSNLSSFGYQRIPDLRGFSDIENLDL